MLYGDPKSTIESFGTHIAVYFILMQGDFDEVLPFPFPHKVVYDVIFGYMISWRKMTKNFCIFSFYVCYNLCLLSDFFR